MSRYKILKWSGITLLLAVLVFAYGILPQMVAGNVVKTLQANHPLPVKTPKDFGLAYQDISFPASDNLRLSGWWIPAPGKKPLGTVFISHGFIHNRDQLLNRILFLNKAGYNVLSFDHRGCGLSDPAPVSGGVNEAKDFLGALKYAEKTLKAPEPFVFFGYSLGAMAAFHAAADAPDLAALVLDSPPANVKGFVSEKGGFLLFLPGFLEDCVWAYDQKTGLSLKAPDLDLLPLAQDLKDLPVFYINGGRDDLAKPKDVHRLFEASANPKSHYFYVQDAGHEETYSQSRQSYEKAVLGFLQDAVKP